MKAAVLDQIEHITTTTVDEPRIEAGDDVIIEVAYAGICGSDFHAFHGKHPIRKPPVILGHEISGIVRTVGADVASVREGDFVTVMPYESCGLCVACQMGVPNVCTQKRVPGMDGWDGCFAPLFRAKERSIFVLSSNSALRAAVLAEPLAVGVHATRVAGTQMGKSVLVLGAGTIGIFTALAAEVAGATEVALTDIDPFKLEFAKRYLRGPVQTFDATSPDLIERLKSRFPNGIDTAYLSSGAATNFNEALSTVRPGGRVVVTGMYFGQIPIDPIPITLNELHIQGSQIYVGEDFAAALEIIQSSAYDIEAIITEERRLDEAQDVFHDILRDGKQVVKAILKVR